MEPACLRPSDFEGWLAVVGIKLLDLRAVAVALEWVWWQQQQQS